jgi:hypothetical protein
MGNQQRYKVRMLHAVRELAMGGLRLGESVRDFELHEWERIC